MKRIEIHPENPMLYIAVLDGKELGRMEYTNWYSASAAIITINNTEYKLGPKGFWHPSTDIFKDDAVVLNVTSRWQGGFVITNPAEPSKPYTFRGQGWFKTGYEVVDYQNEIVLDIQGNFIWKKFNSGYTITCTKDFGNSEFDSILLLLSVHLYKAMQTAAVIGATA
ncbi:hypothetical protein ACX0HA_10300 [Flavobacterium hauense]